MIFYICLAFLTIGLILIGYSIIIGYKGARDFRGDSFRETPFVKTILDAIVPSAGTSKYIKYDDYIFILDSRKTIRDLYLYKVVLGVIAVIIAFAVVGTNVYTRYEQAYAVTEERPISISPELYGILSQDLTFDKNQLELDYGTLKSNISMIESTEEKVRMQNTQLPALYSYISSIHSDLSSAVQIWDFLIIIGIIFVGWNIPNWILVFLYKMLETDKSFEFDSLETDIYLMSNEHVYRLLETLESSAMYYKEIFYHLRMMYYSDREDMYNLVATRREFPGDLQQLMRYVNMVETMGPDYVRTVISSNKRNTQERMFMLKAAVVHKRLNRVNVICTIAFVIGALRLLLVILKMNS